MAELVDSVQEVIENILRYREALQRGAAVSDQLRQVQHWYCVSDPVNPYAYLWGPAKFIGYKNMTATKYARLARMRREDGGLHGSDARSRLAKFFFTIDSSRSNQFLQYSKLDTLLRKWIEQVAGQKAMLRERYKIHYHLRAGHEETEVEEGDTVLEGDVALKLTAVGIERNRAVRTRCLERHGFACAVCGLDFGKQYGAEFEGIVHVHHKFPMANGKRHTDPVADCVPLCPNCHTMAHYEMPHGECRTIEELRQILSKS